MRDLKDNQIIGFDDKVNINGDFVFLSIKFIIGSSNNVIENIIHCSMIPGLRSNNLGDVCRILVKGWVKQISLFGMF